MSDDPEKKIDWSLTSWDGARRETLRRWSKLPLEEIIAALEEMETLNHLLHGNSRINETRIEYVDKANNQKTKNKED